ncbi:MAG: hypothetical protein QOD12_2186, partial [Verrucomicrobiota bacterium]
RVYEAIGSGGEIQYVSPSVHPLNWVSYPFLFVLPLGKLLVHSGTETGFVNLSTFAREPTRYVAARPRTYNLQGTSVLLPLTPGSNPPYRARIMAIGGGSAGGLTTPATETCEILDLGATSPAWRPAAPMARPRVMPDSVLLPDGKVLVVNGSSTGAADAGPSPVYEAELYDPTTNTWRIVCNMTTPRLYHATALLLPDGRVLTAGTDPIWNPVPFDQTNLTLEIFSPPYLFQGARPRITAGPLGIAYQSEFRIGTPDAAFINKATVIRCSSVTHSFNSDQRYVELAIVRRSANELTLQAPPDSYVAPPGYYMLFVLRDGVPSVGRFIRLPWSIRLQDFATFPVPR